MQRNATATRSPRNRHRSNGKAIADAVSATTTPTAPAAPAPIVATPSAPTAPAPTTAPDAPTARQTIADAGKVAARALSSDVARKAMLAALGTVKRSDLLADKAHNVQRALERLRRADLKALARRLSDLADFVAVADATPSADLIGANVATRAGSVSVAALICGIADASSKADALAMFATAD